MLNPELNGDVEVIICAANWYCNLEGIKNDIPSLHFRPKNISHGIVFCGHRHTQCLYQMVIMTGKRQFEVQPEVQGFLTNKNRFVDRTEGAKIALSCGQIKKLNFSKTLLYSEDIY